MPAARFDPAVKAVLDELLLVIPGVLEGTLFGYPGYSINGKVFASLKEDGISLKLAPPEIAAALQQPHISQFTIMGKPMRDWVFIQHPTPDDYRNDLPLLQQSLEFVAALPAKKSKKK